MGRQVGVRCDRKLGDQQEVGGEEKSLQRQLWEIEKFASVDPVFRERQNKMWKEDLQEIERKRPDRACAGASEYAEEVTKSCRL